VTSWFFPLPLASVSNPAPVDIQPTRTPSKHVLRHRRFRQWLPCEDDWIDGGLQSGSPAFPLFRFGGGGGGYFLNTSPIFVSTINIIPFIAIRLCLFLYSNNFPFCPQLLVNRFGYVQGFGEAGAIKPHQTVADLKTGIFDSAGQTMISAGAAES